MPFADHDRICRNPDISFGEVDDELVALSLERGECFGLDKIGTLVWRAAEQPVRFDALVAAMTERFEVEEATCRADLAEFLDEVIDAGMMQRCP